jgi:hypothetical protein
MGLNNTGYTLRFGTLPAGESYDPQSFADKLAEQAEVLAPPEITPFGTGPSLPTSDSGPFLLNGREWYVWDINTGAYVPATIDVLQIPPSLSLNNNLLLNPDFRISQRTFVGGAIGALEVQYDTWRTGASGATVSELNGTVTLTAGTVRQVIEQPNLNGRTLTFSAFIVAGTLSVDIDGQAFNLSSAGFQSHTLTIADGSTGDIAVALSGTNTVFRDIKLEVGQVRTQFVPPIRSEELRRVRRYFVRLNLRQAMNGTLSSYSVGDNVFFRIPVPTEMLQVPASGNLVATIATSDLTDFQVWTGEPGSTFEELTPAGITLAAEGPSSFAALQTSVLAVELATADVSGRHVIYFGPFASVDLSIEP